MTASPSSTRVLRGIAPRPYAFEVLDGEAVSSPDPPAFVPLLDLTALAVVEGDPDNSSDPDPLAPALAEAFENGRQAGREDRDQEVADLQAETHRLTAALGEATDAADQQEATVREAAERLRQHWTDTVKALEPAMAALAVEVAGAVLDAPLSDEQRDATDRALAAAIDSLASDAPVSVVLHPVDLLHLQESGLADSIAGAHPGLRWEPDSTVAEGDWSASTPDAAVRRIRTDMFATLRERLGLPAA